MSKRILASLLSGLSMQFEDVTAASVRGAVEIARNVLNEQETENRKAALRRATLFWARRFLLPKSFQITLCSIQRPRAKRMPNRRLRQIQSMNMPIHTPSRPKPRRPTK